MSKEKTRPLRILTSHLCSSGLDSWAGTIKFYVTNVSDCLCSIKSYQYADDTTIYLHEKPTYLKDGEKRLQQALNESATWLADCNLCLNPTKTKVMLFSTQQLSSFHGLETCSVEISADGKKPERLKTSKLLGTIFQEYRSAMEH